MGVIPQGLRTTRESSRVPSNFEVKNMDKQNFIKAFNEGRILRNGDITIQKGDYFSLYGEFLLKTTGIKDTDHPSIVIVGDPDYIGGMNLHIAVEHWTVSE